MSVRQLALRKLASRPFSRARPDELMVYATLTGVKVIDANGDEVLIGEQGPQGDPGADGTAGIFEELTTITTDTTLVASPNGTGGVRWAPNEGGGGGVAELDYVQRTTGQSVTAHSEAAANTLVTCTAIAFDGATDIIIEFYSSVVFAPVGAGNEILITLFDGSTAIGTLADLGSETSAGAFTPIYVRKRFRPAAATKTYSLRAWTPAGTGSVSGNANAPMFARITTAGN